MRPEIARPVATFLTVNAPLNEAVEIGSEKKIDILAVSRTFVEPTAGRTVRTSGDWKSKVVRSPLANWRIRSASAVVICPSPLTSASTGRGIERTLPTR